MDETPMNIYQTPIKYFKQKWNTIKKDILEGMIILPRQLKLKGKRKATQRKMKHIFMHKYNQFSN